MRPVPTRSKQDTGPIFPKECRLPFVCPANTRSTRRDLLRNSIRKGFELQKASGPVNVVRLEHAPRWSMQKPRSPSNQSCTFLDLSFFY